MGSAAKVKGEKKNIISLATDQIGQQNYIKSTAMSNYSGRLDSSITSSKNYYYEQDVCMYLKTFLGVIHATNQYEH